MRTSATIRRTTRTALAAALAGIGLTGCGVLGGGVYDAPLPGGADVGDDPITVTAEFADVLDLVPQSSVKVDNVSVGRVTDVTLDDDGRTAVVRMEVRGDVDLPAATVARLQQTSLLGEKYVALVRPEGGGENMPAPGRLADGAVLTTADTDAAATAEQVLGALSLVLNGGGIGQFQEISRELQKAGSGQTAEVRAYLEQLNRFVGVLDERKSAITDAIDGLARLSETLDGDREQIAHVLDELSPGMKVLVEQRPQLTRMLRALDRLSKITVRTLDASQRDMVRDLRALDPILSELAKAGADLPHSLEILLTYPFPDSVLGAIRGDYLNVFMTTNFRTLPAGCAAVGCLWPQPFGPLAGGSAAGSRRTSPSPRQEPPPTMLPSTDSATPATGTPTVPGPSILPSAPTGSPGSPGSSGSSGPSGSPSHSDAPSPGGSSSGAASPSGSATSEGGQ